jgi:hypothetical protein
MKSQRNFEGKYHRMPNKLHIKSHILQRTPNVTNNYNLSMLIFISFVFTTMNKTDFFSHGNYFPNILFVLIIYFLIFI